MIQQKKMLIVFRNKIADIEANKYESISRS